jgi:hypothetical protein
VAPDLDFIHANRTEPALTWIGHSSMLWQIDGVNLLIDPVFSARASPVRFAGPKRHQPPGLRANQLPRIDAVVLSHNHYDHLDRRSMRDVAVQTGGPPAFIVPRGTESWFAANLPRAARDARVIGCAGGRGSRSRARCTIHVPTPAPSTSMPERFEYGGPSDGFTRPTARWTARRDACSHAPGTAAGTNTCR